MEKIKYVKTIADNIIIFSRIIDHNKFKSFNIISAGFIDFYVDDNNLMTCYCYGKSTTLGLKSDPEKDTYLARLQFFNYD